MAGIGTHATWILARVCFRLTTFWMSYKIPTCLFLLMRWQDKSASVPAVATGDPTMALLWEEECEHRKLSKSEGSVGKQARSRSAEGNSPYLVGKKGRLRSTRIGEISDSEGSFLLNGCRRQESGLTHWRKEEMCFA